LYPHRYADIRIQKRIHSYVDIYISIYEFKDIFVSISISASFSKSLSESEFISALRIFHIQTTLFATVNIRGYPHSFAPLVVEEQTIREEVLLDPATTVLHGASEISLAR